MLVEKAKKIRLLILDVDGVLTSGLVFYGDHIQGVRAFHIHDGLGMKVLQKAGVEIAVISAKKSDGVLARLKELGVKHVYLGYEKKLPAYEEIKKLLNLENEAIAYMGDDLPDLPILKQVGFSATVPNAVEIVKHHVDYISKKNGGEGAVRELAEFILKAQDQFDFVINSYLNQT